MQSPKRYFRNKMPDYASGSVAIGRDELKERIVSKAKWILKHCRASSSQRECDGGLYIGISGVAYAFWRLSTSETLNNNGQVDFLKSAQQYARPSLSYAEKETSSGDPVSVVGFLLGNSGVFAMSALIAKASGDDAGCNDMVNRFADAATVCLPVNFLPQGGDELLVGRAGYLSGILTLRRALNVEVVNSEIVDSILNSAVTSGREYSKRHRSSCPLMFSYHHTEYLGAAHGLSGILQMLLCFPSYLQRHADVEKDVRSSVDFLLSLQQPNGNFPCATDEEKAARSAQDELVHWCHGAPGVVYLMAKAFLFWNDERYLQSCLRCGDLVWEKGLLRKGPGICHGIAGSGYVFLILYRLTKEERHLHRAVKFADFMTSDEFHRDATTPDSPYSLYEGWAGTLCFLADLLHPHQSHFPFFEIF